MNDRMNVPDTPEVGPVPMPFVVVKEPVAWEYKRLTCPLEKGDAPTEDELNALGVQGWELAGIYTDAQHAHFYFKRLAT